MKTNVYCLFSAFFLLLFASCNEDEVLVQPNNIDSISKTSNAITSHTKTITADMIPYISYHDQKTLGVNLSNKIIRSLATSDTRSSEGLRVNGVEGGMVTQQGIDGPYVVQAPPTRIVTNGKFSFPNGIGNLAGGIYFCDIYESTFSVTLTPGSFLIFQGAAIEGYSNTSTQTIGVSSSIVGQITTYRTYSVIVRSNVVGQTLNAGPFPTNLNNNTYTYSIYRP